MQRDGEDESGDPQKHIKTGIKNSFLLARERASEREKEQEKERRVRHREREREHVLVLFVAWLYAPFMAGMQKLLLTRASVRVT